MPTLSGSGNGTDFIIAVRTSPPPPPLGNGVFDTIPFDTIRRSSGMSMPTTASFTTPTTGLYYVSYCIATTGSTANNNDIVVRIRDNGSAIVESVAVIQLNSGNVSSGSVHHSFVHFFNSGTTIDLQVKATNGTGMAALDSADYRSAFSMARI